MSSKLFQSIEIQYPGRSVFDLSHNKKATYKMGYLYPNLYLPCSPGDFFTGRTLNFMRLQPLLFPVLHGVDVYQRYFFVPYRLLCTGWEKWFAQEEGNQPLPEDPTSILPSFFTVNYAISQHLTVGSLADHLGIPPAIIWDGPTQTWRQMLSTDTFGYDNRISMLPLKAYNLIWNHYYRDQNLEEEFDINPDEMGEIDYASNPTHYGAFFQLRRANWSKDYFTSALPNTQKGNPVTLGERFTSGYFPVESVPFDARNPRVPIVRSGETGLLLPYAELGSGAVDPETGGALLQDGNSGDTVYLDPNGTLRAKIQGTAEPFTIEALRLSMMLQKYYELLMRGGSRYVEQLRNIFGVTPDDLRIGRPKYLGGGVQNIMISEVLQHSQSSDTSVLGEYAGKGTSIGNNQSFKHYCTEHGVIMGIMCILPRTGYGQGLPKEFWKEDPFEFLNPKFDHLGEQPVRSGELFFDYTKSRTDNLKEFGYMPNYMEYRTIPDSLAGEMRTTLSSWHLNRLFQQAPLLNGDFIKVKDQDTERIFAVDPETADPVIAEVAHNIRAVRPLSKYGTPKF